MVISQDKPPKPGVSQAVPSSTSGLRIAIAAVLTVLGIVFLLFGLSVLTSSANGTIDLGQTLLPSGAGQPVRTSGQWLQARSNGIFFAAGIGFVLSGLFTLNRGTRRPSDGLGVFDRLATQAENTVWRATAMTGALLAFGWFIFLLFAHTQIHWSVQSAAAAFKADVPGSELITNGPLMYGVSFDGETTHIAAFTPALYRALEKVDVSVGGAAPDFEYPIPGLLPILILAALCAAAIWNPAWRLPASLGSPRTWRARGFLAFAILHLYLLLWLVSAQTGLQLSVKATGDVFYNPDWVIDGVLVLASQAALLTAVHARLRSAAPDSLTAALWMSRYIAVALLIPAWGYYFSDTSERSAALLWLLLYLGLAALFWFFLLWSFPAKAKA